METVHLGIEGGTGERRTAPVEDAKGVIDSGSTDRQRTQTDGAEVEGVDVVGLPTPIKTKGEGEHGKKVRRARVRFGGEEEVLVEVVKDPGGKEGGDGHAGHGHEHGREHDHAHAPRQVRPVIRHDKPELYEF